MWPDDKALYAAYVPRLAYAVRGRLCARSQRGVFLSLDSLGSAYFFLYRYVLRPAKRARSYQLIYVEDRIKETLAFDSNRIELTFGPQPTRYTDEKEIEVCLAVGQSILFPLCDLSV